MTAIRFQVINWDKVPGTEHKGQVGTSFWRTLQFGNLRMRIVEYGPGYLADHWCRKGHIVHCLEGAFDSELDTGEVVTLVKGMTYIVSDNMSSHRSLSRGGVKLLIVDGDFLAAGTKP